MLSVHAATSPEMVAELSDLVAAKLSDIANAGPTETELQRSKAQLKAGLLMALESSAVNAEQMARQLLSHGRLIPITELIEKVDAVDKAQVRDFARTLADEAPSVAVIGSGRKSRPRLQVSCRGSRRGEISVALGKVAR